MSLIGSWLIATIKFLVLLFVLLIWTVQGTLLWIPLLARSILTYSCVVMISSFRYVRMEKHQARLEYAISFLINGYGIIFKTFQRVAESAGDSPEVQNRFRLPDWSFIGFVLLNLLIAGAFWWFSIRLIPPRVKAVVVERVTDFVDEHYGPAATSELDRALATPNRDGTAAVAPAAPGSVTKSP